MEEKLHIIQFGNKMYDAERYIKDTEMKKDIIKDSIGFIERYIEENKEILICYEGIPFVDGKTHDTKMTINDVLYFINKIKECVN